MSKGIEHPANSWAHAELFLEVLVSHLHVQNYFLIISGAFVVRDPAALHDLQPSLFYQSFDKLLIFTVQIPVKHLEDFHITISESTFRILGKLINHALQDSLNVCSILRKILSSVVLVNRLPPPGILMRVHHHVHCQRLILVCPV